MDPLPASCVILAGGKSRRMGQDKRWLEVDGQVMLVRTLRVCEALFDDVIIVTAVPEALIETPHRLVHDVVQNCASIGGIYTGLQYASCDYAFVVACDMPWIEPDLVAFLIGRVQESEAARYDVVIPQLDSGLQPTHAVYSKRCLPFLKEMVDNRTLKVQALCQYDDVSVRYVSAEEMKPYDHRDRAFVNINTPEDLERARRDAHFDHSPRRTG